MQGFCADFRRQSEKVNLFSSGMLKKSTSVVLASFRSSTYRWRFSDGGSSGGVFLFAKIH